MKRLFRNSASDPADGSRNGTFGAMLQTDMRIS